MIGFRNSDFYPYEFSCVQKEGFEELQDEYNPGFIKELDLGEAHTFLFQDLINFQKNFSEKIKQEPGF
jgi:hypothetical protein